MLPTDYSRATSPPIMDLTNNGVLRTNYITALTTSTFYHLYFTSDEEIKEGDWYLDTQTKQIKQYLDTSKTCSENILWDCCKKIIATTDKSLTLKIIDSNKSKPIDTGKPDKYKTVHLPSPSQAFIQKYCEQGGIDKVLVEYKIDYYASRMLSKNDDVSKWDWQYYLKIDSHNTISTFPIKDNSEHIYHINQLVNHLCSKIDKKTIDIVRKESTNWINENL